jgi:hypothetical protein
MMRISPSKASPSMGEVGGGGLSARTKLDRHPSPTPPLQGEGQKKAV